MPVISDRPFTQGGKLLRWQAPVAAASIIATSVWLGACGMMQDWPPPDATGTQRPAVEAARHAPGAIAPGPIAPGPIAPGPIVLAPGMTGVPPPTPAHAMAAAPAPASAPPSRTVPPAPAPLAAPAAAMPAAAVDIPTVAPAICPPGTVAMWSQPDAAGAPVAICRRLGPLR